MAKRSIFDFKHYSLISNEIGSIERNAYYPFFSDKWSMHELMLYLLSFSDTAKVTLTSYSISEISIRVLANAMEAGYISELNCLFDSGLQSKKTSLLLFIKNVVNRIFLNNSHAKILLIENETWKIVVVGSANLNENLRYESGMICTVPQVYDYYFERVTDLFTKSIIVK